MAAHGEPCGAMKSGTVGTMNVPEKLPLRSVCTDAPSAVCMFLAPHIRPAVDLSWARLTTKPALAGRPETLTVTVAPARAAGGSTVTLPVAAAPLGAGGPGGFCGACVFACRGLGGGGR